MKDAVADTIAAVIAKTLLYGARLLLFLLLAPIALAVIIVCTAGLILWEARYVLAGIGILVGLLALGNWLIW